VSVFPIITNQNGYRKVESVGFPFELFKNSTQKQESNEAKRQHELRCDRAYAEGFEKGFGIAYDRLEKEMQDLREYIKQVQIINIVSNSGKL